MPVAGARHEKSAIDGRQPHCPVAHWIPCSFNPHNKEKHFPVTGLIAAELNRPFQWQLSSGDWFPLLAGYTQWVATGSFLVSEFQWFLRGDEIEGFNLGRRPVAVSSQKRNLNFAANLAEAESRMNLPFSETRQMT